MHFINLNNYRCLFGPIPDVLARATRSPRGGRVGMDEKSAENAARGDSMDILPLQCDDAEAWPAAGKKGDGSEFFRVESP